MKGERIYWRAFKEYMARPRDCWNWIGCITPEGYGLVYDPDTSKLGGAHRFFYEALNGPIPKGMHLDHLCRNPACVNPRHLEAVTPRENTRRGNSPSALAQRTNVCHRGHAFTSENTMRRKGVTYRACRECDRERTRRYRRERKAS